MKEKRVSKESKQKVKAIPIYSSSKIDQIVPYEDELDYIRDFDGDYGLDEVSFRFEFEMSPDGKHVLRPIYELHPSEINSTHELLIRETKLLGKAFGYSEEQLKNKALFRELYRIVFLWYFVARYPLSDLRKLVKTGYFKHPSDVEDFIILIDDFTRADEICERYFTSYSENSNPGGTDPANEESEEEDEVSEESEEWECQNGADLPQLSYYDVEKEHEIFQRISEINRQKAKETDPEKVKALEEEKKALIAEIYRIREEFLLENGLTYDEFILMRRALQIEKTWGWAKYPIDGEDEETENRDKWTMIKEKLLEKARELAEAMEAARMNGEVEKVKELFEKRKKILDAVKRIESKQMTKEEKKIAKIHSIIDEIYRCGKDESIRAYRLSEEAKALIKSVKSRAMRQALYKHLDEVWKKRKERLTKILTVKTESGLRQTALFNL